MKCPICDCEIKSVKQCSNCGFNQIKTEFLTEEDYHHWMEDTVIPCQTVYRTQLKEVALLSKQLTELKKENEQLKKNQMVSGRTLYDFFNNNGFEVIDKRSSGGCLWVVGTKTEIEPYLKEAKNLFNIGDNGFSYGRSTSGRMGWYTNSND